MKRGLIYKKERFNLYLFENKYKNKINISKNKKNIKYNFNKFKIIKIIYGIRQKQLKVYLKKLKIINFNNLDRLIFFLEKRLDSMLYRAGLYNTRLNSRKQIIHNNIKVNGVRVNKPSYILKINDIIETNFIIKKKIENKNFKYYENKIIILKYFKINECKLFEKI
ncbi:S4 domain-containing protein [Candidatus Vidania fulgoroideorum]